MFNVQRSDAYSRQIRQSNLAFFHRHTHEAVVRDEQISVKVGKIYGWRELGGSTHRTRGFRHAANHHLHVQSPGEIHHLSRLTHARTFHQLDVNAMKSTLQTSHIT